MPRVESHPLRHRPPTPPCVASGVDFREDEFEAIEFPRGIPSCRYVDKLFSCKSAIKATECLLFGVKRADFSTLAEKFFHNRFTRFGKYGIIIGDKDGRDGDPAPREVNAKQDFDNSVHCGSPFRNGIMIREPQLLSNHSKEE